MSLPNGTTRASRRLSLSAVAPSAQKTPKKPSQSIDLVSGAINVCAEVSANASRSEVAEIASVARSQLSSPPSITSPTFPSTTVPPVQFGDKVFDEVLAKFREGIANKPICGKQFESTKWHDFASFPQDGSFIACHGSFLHDPRLTFCKLFDNAGIIHMERHSQRKMSKTNGHPIVS
jgi:hypothetical protein